MVRDLVSKGSTLAASILFQIGVGEIMDSTHGLGKLLFPTTLNQHGLTPYEEDIVNFSVEDIVDPLKAGWLSNERSLHLQGISHCISSSH